MDRSVTITTRALLTGLLVAVALLAAYLLGGSGGGTPAVATSSPPAEDRARELTMTGTGEASAVPDQLSFAVRVNLTRPDLDAALAAANASMARVLAALADQGVKKADVQTTGLSMDPVYEYRDDAPPVVVGYRVSERARALVRDLRDGGAAVSAAVTAGGNDVRVDGLRLLVGDDAAVMEQARKAAVEEARAKAEQYAAASGEELGEVVTIQEVRAKPVPTPMTQAGTFAAYGRAADVIPNLPIRAGREEGKVTVRIVWQLA